VVVSGSPSPPRNGVLIVLIMATIALSQPSVLTVILAVAVLAPRLSPAPQPVITDVTVVISKIFLSFVLIFMLIVYSPEGELR